MQRAAANPLGGVKTDSLSRFVTCLGPSYLGPNQINFFDAVCSSQGPPYPPVEPFIVF